MEDTYGNKASRELDIKMLFRIFSDKGVKRLYVKPLSSNDNSKNQIYLGGDFSAINVIPVQSWETFSPSSKKDSLVPGRNLIRGSVSFKWVDCKGSVFEAPDSKLILYPQYPEVRFSGFLKGSQVNISEWMDVGKSGRALGRYLVVGIHPDGTCYGFLAVPGSQIANSLEKAGYGHASGVLKELIESQKLGITSKDLLIHELRRIYKASPIQSKKMDLKVGKPVAYEAANGAGFTLEAELGIFPNGYAAPDFEGWEVKAHGGNVVTLMTPEPSGGFYQDKGVDFFIRKYGYPDKNEKQDRLNFGGVHKTGERHPATHLLMEIKGFDSETHRIDVDGSIYLSDLRGNVAAEWSFAKLLEHWNKKHAQAAYVPYKKQMIKDRNYYSYNNMISLGEGTDFLKFIEAFYKQAIYYDPGIKMVGASVKNPEIKRRSQFRINFKKLSELYSKWDEIDVLKY